MSLACRHITSPRLSPTPHLGFYQSYPITFKTLPIPHHRFAANISSHFPPDQVFALPDMALACPSSVSFKSFQGLKASPSVSSQARISRSNVAFPNAASKRLVAVAAVAEAPAAAGPAVLPVLTMDGANSGKTAELNLRTARPETAKAVVHRAVVTYMQNKRAGTASTKTRAEVRGGGRKPMKQKGTGGARRGSQRTPLRPGGGVVFGPKPKDWTIKINKKEKLLAVGTALQNAATSNGGASFIVIEDVHDKVAAPKTKDFVAALARWGVDYKKDHALLLTGEASENLLLSTRNIENLKVVTTNALNIYDVLRADKLLVTESGLEYLNQRFGDDVLFVDGEEDEEEGEEASDA
ncbi:unnamed protein product [Closterium sp. Naga37s-1]|nr:unnamed protein product [Closterium sp. Naga37s-1]